MAPQSTRRGWSGLRLEGMIIKQLHKNLTTDNTYINRTVNKAGSVLTVAPVKKQKRKKTAVARPIYYIHVHRSLVYNAHRQNTRK